MPAALTASTFYYPTTYGSSKGTGGPKPQKAATTPTGSRPGQYAPTKPPATVAVKPPTAGTVVTPTATAPTIADFAKAMGSGAYNYDPALAAIAAQSGSDVAQAETAALEQKRKALLALGSSDLARSVLGAGDPTLSAISDNPDTSTSALARIGKFYRDQTVQANDQWNAANLWYSTARTKGLGDLAHNQVVDTADAVASAQDQLSQIGAALLDAKNTAARNDAAAAAQADYKAAQDKAIADLMAQLAGQQGGGQPAGGGPTINLTDQQVQDIQNGVPPAIDFPATDNTGPAPGFGETIPASAITPAATPADSSGWANYPTIDFGSLGDAGANGWNNSDVAAGQAAVSANPNDVPNKSKKRNLT